MENILSKTLVSSLNEDDTIPVGAGGELHNITLENLRKNLNNNDLEVLNNYAFYIDINKASSLGSTRVDVGGNLHMMAVWANNHYGVLMDKDGNYTRLNPNDYRYTADGTQVVNDNGSVVSPWTAADFMEIIRKYYGFVQIVTVGGTTFPRLWLSPVQLPNGYEVPQQVVGKFKLNISSNQARSIPNVVPSASQTIRSFWDYAQNRSKSHGLANADFRDYLLFYTMGKYTYRDSQNCQTSDGTLVWGVGLDGSENTTSSQLSGFDRQKGIVTGATLSLGDNDGKSVVTDSEGGTCHSVNVAGFENPWGQFWEFVGGLCSVGSTVYRWRSNFIPPTSSNPTAETFANIDHVELTRSTTNGLTTPAMNMVTSSDGMGAYMIPKESISGVSYGDYYWYDANGQVWLVGGSSNDGATCGLAFAYSHNVWSISSSAVSARLAYYGDVKEVSSRDLAALLAA